MSTHYPNLAAGRTAACDQCGGPAGGGEAYRQAGGWVRLCPACRPEHHAAYHASRVRPNTGGSRRDLTPLEHSIQFPADRPPIDGRRR